MGWFGSSPSKVSTVSEYTAPQPTYLEDLPPKFEDVAPASPLEERQATLVDAAKQFKWSDLTVDRFVTMPCFREAMITGFQAMGVLGTVTFLIHKNPTRSFNWAVCGFFMGNVVGWEQCRSIRRKQFQMMDKARAKKEEHNMKKLHDKEDDPSSYDKFKEFNDK